MFTFVTVRDRYLKCVVLSEGDDLHDLPHPGEDLKDNVECDGIHHVLHDDPEDGVGASCLILASPSQSLGCLQGCLRRGRGIEWVWSVLSDVWLEYWT